MPAPTYTLPTIGSPNSTEDPLVRTALSDLKTLLTGQLDTDNLAAGAVVNADVNASAAIAYSKLASASTGQALIGNAGTPTMTTLSGDVTVGATGTTAIGASKVTNAMMADNAIDTAEIADNAVTKEELATAVNDAIGLTETATTRRTIGAVLTEETTTSTTWADLATPGPSATITCTASGFALVGISVEVKNSAGQLSEIGLYESTDRAISGAPEAGEQFPMATGIGISAAAYTSLPYTSLMLVPVTAGSRTFTMKYAVNSASTATYKNRVIWAVAFGGFA